MEYLFQSKPKLRKSMAELIHLLEGVKDKEQILLRSGKKEIELPKQLAKFLVQIAEEVQAQDQVRIVIVDSELTTQQAADFLDVSRPTLIKMIDTYGLQVKFVGKHRRLSQSQVEFLSKGLRAKQEAAIRDGIREEQLIIRAESPGLITDDKA